MAPDPYVLLEIELSQPMPELQLGPSDRGVALLVRHRGVPIGFAMNTVAAGARVSREEIARWVEREVGPLPPSAAYPETPLVEETTPPSLTVAICTRNNPERLHRCLASVGRLRDERPDWPLEVLVVDNASADGRTAQVVAETPGVRYRREDLPGLDFARNRALREARGELVAFFDDDVTVDRGWLSGLRGAWARHPDAAAFTGPVLPAELSTRAQVLFELRGGFGRRFTGARFGPTPGLDRDYPTGTEFGTGCNMTFRRAALLALGGFDEALDTGAPLPGGGDLDAFYRLVRNGHTVVYDPGLLVFHEHRREYRALRRQYWTWGLGFMAFLWKSYRAEPGERERWRRVLTAWFRNRLDELKDALGSRGAIPADLILAEIGGGIVGLLGEYPRSRRRVAKLRREHTRREREAADV